MVHAAAIAINTVRELTRSRVLYLVLFFAAALVAACSLFGSVTIGDQSKVIKDFGLFAVSLFSVAFAVIAGSTLLQKELSRKTIYNILAKPVSRAAFLLGKFAGIAATTVMLQLFMSAALGAYLMLFEGRFDLLLVDAVYFQCLETMLISAAVIFFSAIVVTPLLSGMFALGFFLAGRSAEQLLYFLNGNSGSDAAQLLLKALYWALPRFDRLYIANETVHGFGANPQFTLYATVYTLSYSAMLLIAANFVFRRREFN